MVLEYALLMVSTWGLGLYTPVEYASTWYDYQVQVALKSHKHETTSAVRKRIHTSTSQVMVVA